MKWKRSKSTLKPQKGKRCNFAVRLPYKTPLSGPKRQGNRKEGSCPRNAKLYVRPGAEKIKVCEFMAGVNCRGKLESLIDLLRRWHG